jgi:hypothetical protein
MSSELGLEKYSELDSVFDIIMITFSPEALGAIAKTLKMFAIAAEVKQEKVLKDIQKGKRYTNGRPKD